MFSPCLGPFPGLTFSYAVLGYWLYLVGCHWLGLIYGGFCSTGRLYRAGGFAF
jgi:hypothetical protein